MHPSLGEIAGGLDRVAIGHLGHVQALALQESGKQEIERTGDACPIEIAGLRARERNELLERCDLERRRHPDGNESIGNPCDGQEIGGLVGQVVVQIGVGCERGGGGHQQDVIVVGIDESADGDNGVPSGAILHHDRLAPARGQSIRQQPCADIDSRSRTERQQEFDRALRPALRRRRRCCQHKWGEQS